MPQGKNPQPGVLDRSTINRAKEGTIIGQGPGVIVDGSRRGGTAAPNSNNQAHLDDVYPYLSAGINVNQAVENQVDNHLLVVGQGPGVQVDNVKDMQWVLDRPEEEFSLT